MSEQANRSDRAQFLALHAARAWDRWRSMHGEDGSDEAWSNYLVASHKKALRLWNRIESRARRIGRRTRSLDTLLEEPAASHPDPGLAEVDTNDSLSVLGSELAEIVILRTEGFLVAEIADRFGWSLRAVGQRMAIARTLLSPDQ